MLRVLTQSASAIITMAKFLHCVRTACILRMHTAHAEAGILTLSSSMAKQQTPHENNETAFNLEINCRYEQAL